MRANTDPRNTNRNSENPETTTDIELNKIVKKRDQEDLMSLMKQMDGLTEPEGYEQQLISTAEQQIIYELTDLKNQECKPTEG